MAPVGRARDGSALLRVHVQPRSSRNQVCGLHDGALKLALTAPPVEGKANRELTGFLAQLFAVSRKSIVLMSGQQARKKVFCFTTLTDTELEQRLQKVLTPE